MPIYLVQHALSLPKEKDSEQGISEEGRADAERIARVAKGYNINVKKIQHSGKRRARQTAELFERVLMPTEGVESSSGLNPLDDATEFADSLQSTSNCMIVSHLPFLERLTSWLIIGKTEHAVFKFQNGGIVCLDKSPEGEYWHIRWTLMPKVD
jgi:phosphohistidine phosphatase